MLTYGEYGGRFVPETLIPALDELEAGWRAAREDPSFQDELDELGRSYAGRPTPLTLAERFAPGKRLYLKREDLLHTGAHKLNNALGQALLALRLGKRRIVAETGAGQHGVATATVCARFGLDCVVYMGSEDMRRQAAEPRADGAARRRGATGRVRDAHAEGGDERGDPRLDRERRGHALPDRLLRRPGAVPGDRARAAVGDRPRGARAAARGRRPAAGGRARLRRRRLERDRALRGFLDDAEVRLVGVEAGGAASLGSGRPAVLHGSRSSVLADEDGQVLDAESISAGFDYPGVGPEHAFLRDSGRAEYVGTSDEEALAAFRRLARTEGILPALEPAHALARVDELDEELVLVCLSGRGDKDLAEVTAR